jgi:uncharacterized sulfatase
MKCALNLRWSLWKCSFAMVLVALLAIPAHAAGRPNILIVLADDCTYNDLPVYGGANARTPNIDRLASEGLTFDRAYLAAAMCQPCRAELYSGQFPLRNGCAWNHSASRPDTRSLPHLLRPLGYRVGLAGKVHVKPAKAFPFEKVAGFDPSCTRSPTKPHELGPLRDFMSRDENQPFCLVVALVEPHVPWVMGDASQYPPSKIKLPPNLADTPKTREDYASYLAEMTYMDGQVGEILQTLAEVAAADNTLVFFSSEQGAQFPGCKWTNWDTGLHTALIARWPGKVAAGARTDAIVHYADVLPTLTQAAGAKASRDPDPPIDGISFLPVLLGGEKSHREFAYGVHNNLPEGPAYPIRSVTDGEYRYIRNLTPDELYIEKHLMGLVGGSAIHNPYWPTWVRATADDARSYALVKRYMRRPAEELYHTASDPYELTNLAAESKHSHRKQRLSHELDRWLTAQGDPGIAEDTPKALGAARQGNHLYGPAEK